MVTSHADSRPLLARATDDLHHAVEQTPLGQALADGSVTVDQYHLWLSSLWHIHVHIDPETPTSLRRWFALSTDINTLGRVPRPTMATIAYTSMMHSAEASDAAIYVLGGATLMGGPVLAKALGPAGLPIAHLVMTPAEKKRALADWRPYRQREDLCGHARQCFRALIDVAYECW